MREDHDHCAEWDRRPHSETAAGGSLTALLDRCGHYFAHRIGASRRGQGNVMACLARNPKMTQKDLAEELGVMPASLSEILMKLERKGFVVREKDENDRRMVRVSLTQEGQKVLEQPDDTLTDPFRVLTREEQETLTKLLAKLLADWEELCTTERKRPGDRPRHGHTDPGDENPAQEVVCQEYENDDRGESGGWHARGHR